MPEMVSVKREGESMSFKFEIRPKRDDEISLWAIATIEMNPFATGKQFELQEKIFSVITESEGLVGAHPVLRIGTFFLYKSEELANKARKAMQESGLPVGKDVTECFIPKADFYVFSADKIQ